MYNVIILAIITGGLMAAVGIFAKRNNDERGTMINKTSERHTVMALLFDESEWGKLNRNTKYKFKKIFKEISPVDLTDLMKLTLKSNEKQLQKQIDFWQREFRF